MLVFGGTGLGDTDTRYGLKEVVKQAEKEAVELGKTSMLVVFFSSAAQMRQTLWRGAKMTKGAWVRSQGFSVVCSKTQLKEYVDAFFEDGEIRK